VSCPSFTNLHGFHFVVDSKTARSDGQLLGNPFHGESYHDVTTDTSYRSPLVRGDHDGPTNYIREIMSVVTDIPFVYRDVFPLGDGTIRDIVTSEYISTKFPTSFMNPPVRVGALRENSYSASITKALNRLRDNTAEIGAAIFEARRTAEELAINAKNLLAAWNAARRGNIALAMRNLGLGKRDLLTGKSAANAWLSLIYGWLPLMNDMTEGAGRLVKGYRDEGFIIMARSTNKWLFEEPFTTGDFKSRWLAGGGTKCQLEARIKSSFLDSLDGSGVLNPLSIAWELVPFSFVVDWVVPIGNILDALTASAGLELAAGFTSEWYDTGFESSVTSFGDGIKIVDGGEFKLRQYRFERKVLDGFPLPRLYAKANPFSTPHILSAVSLIRTAAGNSSRRYR